MAGQPDFAQTIADAYATTGPALEQPSPPSAPPPPKEEHRAAAAATAGGAGAIGDFLMLKKSLR